MRTVYLIRHAEAQHNVEEEYDIPDAPLTEKGQHQAAQLLEKYPELTEEGTKPQIVLVSPLTRTIQTAITGFKFKDPSTMIIPMAELQERSSMPCDTGSELCVIRKKFPDLDFTHVPENWNCKQGEWASHEEALVARSDKLRNLLGERTEERIAIISHGSFISHLLGEKQRFDNVECRKFVLKKNDKGCWALFNSNEA